MQPATYEISEDEYLAFWHLATRKGFWSAMAVFFAYLLLLIGVQVFAPALEWALWISVALAAFLGFAMFQRFVGGPRVVRATYRDDAGIKEPVTLTIDAETFQRSFPNGSLRTRWADAAKWSENEEIFAIFVNRQNGHVFPKAKIPKDVIDTMRVHLIESGLPMKDKLRK